MAKVGGFLGFIFTGPDRPSLSRAKFLCPTRSFGLIIF